MLTYSIYRWTNKVTNGVYIGSTSKTVEQRAGKNMIMYKTCDKFYAAIQKYGSDAFSCEILYTGLSRKEAAVKEIALIKEAMASGKECYNKRAVSSGCVSPRKSPKTSETLRKNLSSPEIRAVMSERMRKVWNDKESRDRILRLRKDKKRGGIPEKKVMVLQTGEVFRSQGSACEAFNIEPAYLSIQLKSKGMLNKKLPDGSIITLVRKETVDVKESELQGTSHADDMTV